MMSKYFALLLFFIPLATSAQEDGESTYPVDEESGRLFYQEVVEVPGSDAVTLYNNTIDWVKSNFTNPSSVFQEKDKEGNKVVGKDAFYLLEEVSEGVTGKSGRVFFTFTIEAKEGKYRYTIDDIFLYNVPKIYTDEWLNATGGAKVKADDYLNQTHTYILEQIESMKEHLANPPQEESDDW